MSKKKKESSAKPKVPAKKKSKKLPIIISCVLGAVIVFSAVIVIINLSAGISRKDEICGYQWTASSAKNASGDEVEMSEIYNTNYTSYQGTLNFTEDDRFSLWLSPGAADDGTHTGKFAVREDDIIAAYFDDGTNTTFKIQRENGKAVGIIIKYNDYDVYFFTK